MMLLMRWWEIFAKISNLMIFGSGATDVSVPSPRKYFYVILILEMHVSILRHVLFVSMNAWYMINSPTFHLLLILVCWSNLSSLEMGGEPQK